MEEGKDQGLNVREKAKQLVNLLKDDERLKNERTRALKAKQRFAQTTSAFGSDGALDSPTSPTYPPVDNASGPWAVGAGRGRRRVRRARRGAGAAADGGEEELQLQLALAMSREEAERDERRRRSDDVRLQLALSQSHPGLRVSAPSTCAPPQRSRSCSWRSVSRNRTSCESPLHLRPTSEEPQLQLALSQSQQDFVSNGTVEKKPEPASHLLDLLDVSLAPAPTPTPSAWPSPPQVSRHGTSQFHQNSFL
ncbi:hypothetical protein ACJJTC_002878 [Scirpophaga incertulas]